MSNPDDRINERYSSGQGAYNPETLSDAENADSAYMTAGADQAEAFANDPANASQPSDSIRNAESTPSNSWNTNYDSFKDNKAPNSSPNQFVGVLKKGGPAGIIGGGLIGAGSLVSFIAAPGSLLVNLKENLVNNFDQQNTSAEIRSRKILAKRLGDDATSGLCGKVTLGCRLNKPSNRMLSQLDSAGIKAIDKNGKVIDKQSWLKGNTRPAFYLTEINLAEGVFEAAMKDGKPVGYSFVDAKVFEKELNENAHFRTAMRKAHNPRWVNWYDKVSTNFLNKLSISKASSNVLDAKDAKTAEKAVSDMAKGESVDKPKVEGLIKEETEKFAKQTSKKMAKGSDATLKVANGICAASKAPGVASKVVRGYRLRNLAAVAYMFLTTADEIKAGNPAPKKIENAGNILTKTVNGKSAMDGAIQYGLFKDVGAVKNSKTINKVLPGSNLGWLDAFNAVANDQKIRNVCSLTSSNGASAAVNALKLAKASSPAGWLALAVDGASWVADKTGATEFIVSGIVNMGMGFLAKAINWDGLLKAILGDATEGAIGEPLGDIIVSSAALSMGSLANVGGNAPLSKKQKVAYDQQVANPLKLAYAEEDRLTHSPLDISNPNTLMGSVATRFIPLVYGGSSAATSFSSLASVSFGALSRFAMPSTLAAGEDAYSQCELDAAVKLSDVAAGPLCDVQYGVPVEWLGTDPATVIDKLLADKQIDAEGNPTNESELKEWIEACSDGDPMALSDCVIDDQKKAYYALYQIDKRMMDSMDDEPVTGANSSAGPSTSSSTTASGWTMPINAEPNPDAKWHMMLSKGLHKGQDFPAPIGTPIYAAHDGTVTKKWDMGDCGWATVIQVAGESSLYMGYQHAETTVEQGAVVTKGQEIGKVGKFCGSGYHLHFSIETENTVSAYQGKDTSKDPMPYLLSNMSPSSSSIQAVSGGDQQLAAKIIANPNVQINSKYQYQFDNYAKGDFSCYISPDILKLVATLATTRKILVYSLNRYCTKTFTSPTSFHEVNGGGNAVDIAAVDGVASTGARAGDIKVMNDAMLILPNRKLQLGQKQCRPSGSLSIPAGNRSVEIDDGCNHIHIGLYP